MRDVAERQSQALRGATVRVHRAFWFRQLEYKRTSDTEPALAVDVEFRGYSSDLDLDDVDLVDASSGENFGSDPDIKTLRADGILDTNAAHDDPQGKPLRVLLVYNLPQKIEQIHLDYWGSRLTDAAVPVGEGTLEVDASRLLTGVEFWPYPKFRHYTPDWLRGRWLILACSIGEGVALVDCKMWPPTFERWSCNLLEAIEPAPQGGWVVITRTGRTREDIRFPIWLHSDELPGTSAPAADAQATDPRLQGIVVVGEGIWTYSDRTIFRFADGRLERVPELPEAQGVSGRHGPRYTHGHVRLADGRTLLVWDGKGYELTDGRWTPSWPERIDEPYEFCTVPWESDGFYYLAQRRVWRTRPGVPPQRVMAALDSVMGIRPGPEGSLAFRLGNNPAGYIGGLWFPDDDTYIPLESGELSAEASSSAFDGLAWPEASERVYVIAEHGLFTLPVEGLLARPRLKLPPIPEKPAE